MTEYLHPGVYVVELEGRTVPIEGVPTSTADLFDKVFLAQLESLAKRFVPEWTDYNGRDPGITLLNLSAWLTEMVLYRTGRTPAKAAPAVARLAAAALHALHDDELPVVPPLRRVRFCERALVEEESSTHKGPCLSIRRQ